MVRLASDWSTTAAATPLAGKMAEVRMVPKLQGFTGLYADEATTHLHGV